MMLGKILSVMKKEKELLKLPNAMPSALSKAVYAKCFGWHCTRQTLFCF
jgi:hypothetical protein